MSQGIVAKLIDVPLWDRARWKGVLFRSQLGTVPALALVFTDAEAAEEIFKAWQALLGNEDTNETIRISIIDGVIPGHGAGYTVHIGPNAKAVIAEAKGAGVSDESGVIHATRFQRMQNPDPENLTRFKQAFQEAGRYWLVPAILTPSGPQLHRECRLLKRAVLFRTPSDIGIENDVDRIVLARPENRSARWN